MHRLLADLAQLRRIEAKRVGAPRLRWNAEELQHMGDAPRGVSAAAEAEQIDAVPQLPGADNGGIAIDDAARQAATEHLFPRLSEVAGLLPRSRSTDAVQVKAICVRGSMLVSGPLRVAR